MPVPPCCLSPPQPNTDASSRLLVPTPVSSAGSARVAACPTPAISITLRSTGVRPSCRLAAASDTVSVRSGCGTPIIRHGVFPARADVDMVGSGQRVPVR